MNILLMAGIILTLSAQNLGVQAVGILVIGVAIFIIETGNFRNE